MAKMTLDNESELLGRIADGDQRAFRVLYDFYGKKAYLFALRILGSELLAEEVMQLSMLKVWQLGEGLRSIVNLDAYLNTLTRNTCYNLLRRAKLEKKLSAHIGGNYSELHDDTQELIQLNETKKVLQNAIDALPLYQRQVYVLCHQEGLKYEEAAERLNLSRATVQTYMKLSLRFLREELAKNGNIAVIVILYSSLGHFS
jgi:RNA polymerase sigma-70 factor (ECF subfamily)